MIIDCNTFFGVWPKKNIDMGLDTVVKKLNANQVDRAVICSLRGILYDYREGNSETLEAIKDHPELIPAATINPLNYTGAETEIESLKKSGFKILRLCPEHQGWPVDFLPLRLILEQADRHNMAAMITIRVPGEITVLARWLEKMQNLKLIISNIHYSLFGEALAAAGIFPQLFVETQRLNGPDTIDIFAEQVGADRLLFGSNSPLDNIQSSKLLVEKADISEKDKQNIFSGNIARLLDLEAT